MAIGPTLQEARLKKQLTTSQVAELTRMKIQIVEDLERDDFHRMAATIYGKGFIRLFAECVGLDPKPLVADYIRRVEGDTPSLIPEDDGNPSMTPTTEVAPPDIEPETKIAMDTEAVDDSPAADAPVDLFSYAKKNERLVHNKKPPAASTGIHAQSENPAHISAMFKQKGKALFTTCRSGFERTVDRLADIPWGDAPLKVVGIIIGILVVLLFVVSGISRCSGPQSDAKYNDSTLQIAVDPPEPYFD